MALSRRQLRAIFAKMAAARAGRAPKSPKIRGTWEGMPANQVQKLLSRLPDSHKRLSHLKRVNVKTRQEWETLSEKVRTLTRGEFSLDDIGGFYNFFTKKITVPGDVNKYTGFNRSSLRYLGESHTARKLKADSAHAFYHEYGHSLDSRGGYAITSRWRKISNKEGPLGSTTNPIKWLEDWAHSYADFARSKSARMRLKGERPETYKYMKDFFEKSKETPAMFWAKKHKRKRQAVQVSALAGGGEAHRRKRKKSHGTLKKAA